MSVNCPLSYSKSSHNLIFISQQQQHTTTMMRKRCSLFLPLLALVGQWLTPARALFPEEAGQLDFLVATAGHGESIFVFPLEYEDPPALEEGDDSSKDKTTAPMKTKTLIITSDARALLDEEESTSCILAARDHDTGELKWRRNVCSQLDLQHAVTGFGKQVVTLDSAGQVRAWNGLTGDLEWETSVEEVSKNAEISVVKPKKGDDGKDEFWVKVSGDSLSYFDSKTGQLLTNVGDEIQVSPQYLTKEEAGSEEFTCPDMDDLKLAMNNRVLGMNSISSRDAEDPLLLTFSEEIHGNVTSFTMVKCQERSLSLLVTTHRRLSMLIQIDWTMNAKTLWTAEEGLSSISSALLVDASHFVADEESGDENTIDPKSLLSFSSRLSMHMQAFQDVVNDVTSLFRDDETSMNQFFGFPKIAVMVSAGSNRVYGMYTSGPKRAEIKYRNNLPDGALWHRLIHGSPNSNKNVRGINGRPHSRDVIVLSALPGNQYGWSCFDGNTGQLHGNGMPPFPFPSPIVQVLPMAAAGSCRQGALAILESGQVMPLFIEDSLITSTPSANGLFAHRLMNGPGAAALQTLLVSPNGTTTSIQEVGLAQFPDESIVTVAYPDRGEVIQSPCNALGDQSLLIKYLNPHLVVVMTKTETVSKEKDDFTEALTKGGSDKGGKQKRKPVGAGNAASTSDAPTVDAEPNLFVNLVDSVSGRVLYRAAHSNAVFTPKPSLLVSENWVFYSFMNSRTRRAEIGVLSLYEGMVDSKGLTAFTTPEQLREFSSLDARESKPVVLAKTYTIPKPVTAMGITNTRGGISGKRLVLASIDGSVFTVERKMLEPRRPMGQVKDTEKQEGLRQYSELVPLVSYTSLSYTQVVEGVKHIISAPTDLESQTVVLCYGGPDIFFVRTSPSRGFDLLPDSFSRVMLAIVVVVLLCGFLFLQRMVFIKTIKKGWV